jgi:ribosomal-protein-alanine N-acetyltransferase
MSVGKAIKPKLRWLARGDMEAVVQIERENREYPWQNTDFIEALELRRCIGLIAEKRRQLVGYLIYDLHKTSLEIVNLVVVNSARRNGIGEEFVRFLKEKLTPHRGKQIWTRLREDNLGAQKFLKAQGFRVTTVLGAYYAVGRRDAFLMRFRTGGAEPTFIHRNRFSHLFTPRAEMC